VWLSISALALLLIVPARVSSAAPAPGVTFTKIADTSTLIPAGQWAGEKFKYFGIPAIDNGKVVFLGVPDSSTNGDNGVYGWKNGALGLVADPSVPHPTGGTLRLFRDPAVQGDSYVFATDGGGAGIFRSANDVVTSIGALPVTRYSAPSIDRADVWFYGYSFGPGPFDPVSGAGVYRARSGSFERLAAHGQPTPHAPDGYRFYMISTDRRVVASGGRAVFWAVSTKPSSPDVSGLYSVTDGVVERVVDSTMSAPGGSGGTFGTFADAAFDADGGYTLFCNDAGVYRDGLGGVTLVVAAGQDAPGGGTFAFTAFCDVAADGGRIAFTDGTNPIGLPHRIYSDVGGTLGRIVGRGDTLFGETITKVQLGPDSLSANQIVFYAQFTSGSSGVFLATIPEPDVARISAAIAALLACAVSRQRTSTRSGHERRP